MLSPAVSIMTRFRQAPLLVLAVLALVRVAEAENKTAKSLFAIVRFPNGECQGSTATSLNGTCFTSSECFAFNGTADGACAMGFGVCCELHMRSPPEEPHLA